MGKANILKGIEEERGIPLDTLIPQTIEQTGGIYQAAQDLRVAPNTIQYWLAANDYVVVRTVKVKRNRRKNSGAA
jgi:hypothetical protein